MEFPDVGANCHDPTCQSLSFLPFRCPFCAFTFCSSHRVPTTHSCEAWKSLQQQNEVQVCTVCQQLVLSPTAVTNKVATLAPSANGNQEGDWMQKHVDSQCTLYLLPAVPSIAQQCRKPGCGRKDRVVQQCGGCEKVFCLKHRHQTDHDCERKKEEKVEKEDKKKEIREMLASRFPTASSSTATSTATGSTTGTALGEKTVKSAVAAAKQKKASKIVAVIKMKKGAKGDDKVPVANRIYAFVKTPSLETGGIKDPVAVFVDKTWTVGRIVDKLIDTLQIRFEPNVPFDVSKRTSIFWAKDVDEVEEPVLLNMQEKLKDAVALPALIENGDVFLLAPANWTRSISNE